MTGRKKRLTPREQYPDFPEGTFDDVTAKAAAIAVNLENLIAEYVKRGYVTSLRDFASKIDVHHTVLGRVLSGERWMDTQVLARLESGTGQPLWQSEESIDLDTPPPFLTQGDN